MISFPEVSGILNFCENHLTELNILENLMLLCLLQMLLSALIYIDSNINIYFVSLDLIKYFF